jgi:hypothetical protein
LAIAESKELPHKITVCANGGIGEAFHLARE